MPIAAAVYLGTSATVFLMTMPMLLGALVKDLGLSIQQIGYIATADLLGLTAGSIAMSILIARGGWRKILTIAVLGMVTGNLVSVFANTLPSLLVARFFTDLFGGCVIATITAALGRLPSPDRNYAFFLAGQTFVGTVGILIAPLVFRLGGIDAMFVLAAAIAAVGILFVHVHPNDNGTSPDQRPVNTDIPQDWLLWMPIGLGALAVLVYFVAQGGLWAYIERLGAHHGLEEQIIANGLAIANFSAFGATMVVVLIGDRFGRVRPLVFAVFATSLAMFSLSQPERALYYFGAITYMAAWNFTIPFLFGILSQSESTGLASVLFSSAAIGGLAIGPVLAGFVIVASDGYDPLLGAAAALTIMSVLLISLLSTPRRGLLAWMDVRRSVGRS
jgi:predicted MFS family arabinose efflux permease